MSTSGRWNWVAVLASLMVIWFLVSDRASGQDLKVTFPPKKRTGKLTLTVQVNPADFPAAGSATLEVETKSGPADLILGGNTLYTRKNSTLEAQVDSFRDGKDILNFDLTLRVKDKNGKERIFVLRKDAQATIDPLAFPQGLEKLQVELPMRPMERQALLTLRATVDPAIFGETAPATVEVRDGKNPERRLSLAKIDYTRQAETLQAALMLSLDPKEISSYAITLLVDDSRGREHAFTDRVPIDPLSLPNPQDNKNRDPALTSSYSPTPNPNAWWNSRSPGIAVLFVVVGSLTLLLFWWLRQGAPVLVYEPATRLEFDPSHRTQKLIIECSVRHQSRLFLELEGESSKEPWEAYCQLESREPQDLEPGNRVEVVVPSDFLPHKKVSRLIVYLRLPESVGPQFYRRVGLRIVWSGRKPKEWYAHVELVWSEDRFGPRADVTKALTRIEELGKSVDELSKRPPAHAQAADAFSKLSAKVVDIERLLGRREDLASLAAWQISPVSGGVKAEIYPSIAQMTHEEASLLGIVNQWWKQENLDRQELRKLVRDASLPVRFYAIKDIIRNLTMITETSFTFEPSDDEGGWLWCDLRGANEALTVPVDPAFFEVGNVMTLVQKMFDGFDRIPDKLRFVRADKACHLRAVPGQPGKYRVVSRGYLLLQGLSDPGFPPPFQGMVPPEDKGGPLTQELSPTQMYDIPLPIILKAHLGKVAIVIDECQQRLCSLASSLERLSQQLSDVEAWRSQPAKEDISSARILGEIGRELRGPLGMLHEATQQIHERLRSFEQAPPAEDHPPVAKLTGRESMASAADEVGLQSLAGDVLMPRFSQDLAPTPEAESRQQGESPAPRKIAGTLPEDRLEGGGKDILQTTEEAHERRSQVEIPGSYGEHTSEAEEREGPSNVLSRAVIVESPKAGDPQIELPPGWKDALRHAFDETGDQPDSHKVDPGHYVKRLLVLKEKLGKLLEASGSVLSAEVTHLVVDVDRFRRHPAQLTEESGACRAFCIECQQKGEVFNLPFQLFIFVERKQGDTASVLLPLGSFCESEFPKGYRMLIEDVPSGIVRIISVARAAQLRKNIGEHGDSYTVTSKMRLQFYAGGGSLPT